MRAMKSHSDPRRTASLWRVWNEHRLMRKLEKRRRLEQLIDDLIADACRDDGAGESSGAPRRGSGGPVAKTHQRASCRPWRGIPNLGNQAMTRHPVTTCSQITWGIIRYPAGSGLHPDDDAVGF